MEFKLDRERASSSAIHLQGHGSKRAQGSSEGLLDARDLKPSGTPDVKPGKSFPSSDGSRRKPPSGLGALSWRGQSKPPISRSSHHRVYTSSQPGFSFASVPLIHNNPLASADASHYGPVPPATTGGHAFMGYRSCPGSPSAGVGGRYSSLPASLGSSPISVPPLVDTQLLAIRQMVLTPDSSKGKSQALEADRAGGEGPRKEANRVLQLRLELEMVRQEMKSATTQAEHAACLQQEVEDLTGKLQHLEHIAEAHRADREALEEKCLSLSLQVDEERGLHEAASVTCFDLQARLDEALLARDEAAESLTASRSQLADIKKMTFELSFRVTDTEVLLSTSKQNSADLSSSCQDLEAVVKSLTEQLAAATEAKDITAAELSASKEHNEQLQKQLEAESKANALRAEAESAAAEVGSLTSEAVEVSARLQDLERRLQEDHDSSDANRRQHEQQLQQEARALAEALAEGASLAEEVQELQRRLSAEEASSEEQRAIASSFEERAVSAEARLDMIQASLSSAEQGLLELRDSLAVHMQGEAELTGRLKTSEDEVSSLRAQLEAEGARHEASAFNAKQQTSELHSQSAELSTRLEGSQAELERLALKLKGTEAELQAAVAESERLTEAGAASEAKLRASAADCVALMEEVAGLKACLAEATASRDVLEQKLLAAEDSHRQEAASLSRRLVEAEGRLAEAHQSRAEAEERHNSAVDGLRGSLAEAQASAEGLRQRLMESEFSQSVASADLEERLRMAVSGRETSEHRLHEAERQLAGATDSLQQQIRGAQEEKSRLAAEMAAAEESHCAAKELFESGLQGARASTGELQGKLAEAQACAAASAEALEVHLAEAEGTRESLRAQLQRAEAALAEAEEALRDRSEVEMARAEAASACLEAKRLAEEAEEVLSRVENRAKREAEDAASQLAALQERIKKGEERLEAEAKVCKEAEDAWRAEIDSRQAVERTFADVCQQLRDEEQAKKELEDLLAASQLEGEATTAELLTTRARNSELAALVDAQSVDADGAMECQEIMQQELDSMAEEGAKLRARLAEAEAYLEELEEDAAAAKASNLEAMRVARVELAKVKEEAQLAQAEVSAEVAGLSSELAAVRENRDEIRASQAARERQLAAALAESENSRKSALAKTKEVEALAERVTVLQAALAEARDTAATAQDLGARLETEQRQLAAELKQRGALAEAVDASRGDLKERLAAVTETLDDLRTEQTAAVRAKEDAEAQLGQLTMEAAKAREQAAEAIRERGNLAQEVRYLRGRLGLDQAEENLPGVSDASKTSSPRSKAATHASSSVAPLQERDAQPSVAVDNCSTASGEPKGGVAWKTNSLPEAQPVDLNAGFADKLLHAAADITSALTSELGALYASSGASVPAESTSSIQTRPKSVSEDGSHLQLTPSKKKLSATPASTPPTPRMGPGWVQEQRSRWERIALKTEAEQSSDGQAAGQGAELSEQLHSLTLIMWQLQSDARSLSESLQAAGPPSDEAALCLSLSKHIDEAVGEVEGVLEDHARAVGSSEALARKVEMLEMEQEEAMHRIQEAGAMWGQAEQLAKRTVQELSKAAQRIMWLEQELGRARSSAPGHVFTSFTHASAVLSQGAGPHPLLADLKSLEGHLAATEGRIDSATDDIASQLAVELRNLAVELGYIIRKLPLGSPEPAGVDFYPSLPVPPASGKGRPRSTSPTPSDASIASAPGGGVRSGRSSLDKSRQQKGRKANKPMWK